MLKLHNIHSPSTHLQVAQMPQEDGRCTPSSFAHPWSTPQNVKPLRGTTAKSQRPSCLSQCLALHHASFSLVNIGYGVRKCIHQCETLLSSLEGAKNPRIPDVCHEVIWNKQNTLGLCIYPGRELFRALLTDSSFHWMVWCFGVVTSDCIAWPHGWEADVVEQRSEQTSQASRLICLPPFLLHLESLWAEHMMDESEFWNSIFKDPQFVTLWCFIGSFK